MKTVDTGKDKVKKICDVLKKETLDPAKLEAEKIISDARMEGEQLIKEAKGQIERMQSTARREIDEERNVFQASLNLASKQGLSTLKQEIESHIFNKALGESLDKFTNDPKIIADLISAIVSSIEKEGIDGDLQAVVSSKVSKEEVNKNLMQGILEKLKEKSVILGEITGGAEVKFLNKNMTLDISDQSLKTLLGNFLRSDFRSILFES